MRIVHLCVSCFYIDGYRYQENELVRQHVQDGHDVLVVASTETYLDNLALGYTTPGQYTGTDGARVIRLPYKGPFPFFIKKKLRIHPGVYKILEKESPDIIVFHGLCGWELLTVSKYKKNNPQVLVYADSHEDVNNSARTLFSKVLHKFFYRPIIHRSLRALEKVLCVSVDTLNFCSDFYKIPKERLELFPLGGVLLGDDEYLRFRTTEREKYGLSASDIVFLQSGKFDRKKKLIDSLRAFCKTSNSSLKFLIVGKLSDEVAQEVQPLIDRDARVRYLGWLPANDLYNLLCAADVYVQPGSQSATMQMSLCARCVVVLDDVPSHRPFVDGNGWLLNHDSTLEMVFDEIQTEPHLLEHKAAKSHDIAKSLLDYQTLAKRLLQ